MCQLYGFSCNKGTKRNLGEEFYKFKMRGDRNPHAWGIAMWEDESTPAPLIIKEARNANKSKVATLITSLDVKTCLAHIRYGTVQPLNSTVNAHPFFAHVRGQDWVFAHNGFISNIKNIGCFSDDYEPIGTTDSEFFFALLCDYLACKDYPVVEMIAKPVEREGKNGKLNFLLSNGRDLYFFSNQKGGLHYKIESNAVIVATEPMEVSREWKEAVPGTLYVVCEGNIAAEVRIFKEATYIPKKKDITDTTSNYSLSNYSLLALPMSVNFGNDTLNVANTKNSAKKTNSSKKLINEAKLQERLNSLSVMTDKEWDEFKNFLAREKEKNSPKSKAIKVLAN